MGYQVRLWGLLTGQWAEQVSLVQVGSQSFRTSTMGAVVPGLPRGSPGPATVPLISDLFQEARLVLLLTPFSTSWLGRQDTEISCLTG